MTLDLTDDEAALLLKELNGLIDGDRYFLSDRIKILKAIRAKIRLEPAREPLPPPPKCYPRGEQPEDAEGADETPYAAEANVATAAQIAAVQRPRAKSITTIKDLNLTSRR
jgi:hypothetical protein